MISFSGIDGSGKSTQIDLLKSFYDELDINYKIIWGRGGWTPGLEFIKNIVRTDKKLDFHEREAYRLRIHENLKKKKLLLIGAILDLYLYFGIYYRVLAIRYNTVICDRYIWDTYVDFKVNYSMFNFENWFIWKALLKFIPYPEKSIILTVSTEEASRRCKLKADVFPESEEIMKKKIGLYCELIKDNKWTLVIDGSRPIKEINYDIKSVLIG